MLFGEVCDFYRVILLTCIFYPRPLREDYMNSALTRRHLYTFMQCVTNVRTPAFDSTAHWDVISTALAPHQGQWSRQKAHGARNRRVSKQATPLLRQIVLLKFAPAAGSISIHIWYYIFMLKCNMVSPTLLFNIKALSLAWSNLELQQCEPNSTKGECAQQREIQHSTWNFSNHIYCI